jgi:type II secretory pathway component PulM
MTNALKEKFFSLPQRDRITLSVGVLIAVCYLFYLLVLSPLAEGITHLEQQVSYQRELIAWMKEADKQFAMSSPTQAINVAPDQLLNVVSKSLIQEKVNTYPNQLRQNADNSIILTFKQIPFKKFMQWMTETWKKYNLKAQKLTMSKLDKEGLVKVSISIK